ncbi:MAG: DM13 domain-containing protein [Cyclobacteriaceae bacterium]
MRILVLTFVVGLLIQGCIGIDVVDDPTVGESVEISPDRLALLVGTSKMADATYYNEFGLASLAMINWSTSASSIATVNDNGLVSGVAKGQAVLFASHSEFKDSIRVSVVTDENATAFVDISSETTSLSNGETVSLSIIVKNINEVVISTGTIQWQSSDEAVAMVSPDGTVTAVGSGTARIVAIVDGVYSNEIEIMVDAAFSGTFKPLGGYQASGTASLKIVDGDLILTFSDDFKTSFALGTYIYLANNNSSGTSVQSGGIELGQITTNGAHTFNVTEQFPGTTISQYKYVIILCKPANVLFGFAELK